MRALAGIVICAVRGIDLALDPPIIPNLHRNDTGLILRFR
jgi:hypothetical protein